LEKEMAEWREIGTNPVCEDAPCGESVRYDPDFELLEAQVQKLESFTRQPVDWNLVVTLGKKILQQKSKDMLVASYMALGLLEREGFAGLSKAIACLEGMIAQYWPGLHPEMKRLRARISALNWLAEKTGSAVSQRETGPHEGAAVTACLAQISALQSLLKEKIGSDAPDMMALLRPLQEHAQQVAPQPAALAPAAEPKSVPAPPASYASAAAFSAAPIETLEDARRLLKDSTAAIRRALSVARGKEPAGPAPYRLVRSLLWSEIDALPPVAEGKSRIPPPPAHLRDRCRSLMEQASWSELLSEAESRVAEFPFWLDLHRMSDQALAGLGPSYAAARGAVKAELISLLNRLPELIELQFADGQPFADEATRRWISTDLFPAGEEKVAAAAAPDLQSDFLADLRQQSRALLREGRPEEAMRLMQEAMRAASTERHKFLAQLELARLCLEAGQMKLALAHFEMLDEQMVRFVLELWEPELCVEALQAYWDALNQAAQASRQVTPEMARRADSIYNRLCKLDVVAGLYLAQGGSKRSIGRPARSG
jgi:type VI secretion system protein VasJ